MYEKVLSDKSKYQYEHPHLRSAFSEHRSQLKSLEQQLSMLNANLVEQLTDSSTRLSKYQKACPTIGGSSRLKRYLTATVVGIISALITNLIWWIVS
jgi:hypothetical protein